MIGSFGHGAMIEWRVHATEWPIGNARPNVGITQVIWWNLLALLTLGMLISPAVGQRPIEGQPDLIEGAEQA
jgi:hypothetical protein